jgi:hypothetical protein
MTHPLSAVFPIALAGVLACGDVSSPSEPVRTPAVVPPRRPPATPEADASPPDPPEPEPEPDAGNTGVTPPPTVPEGCPEPTFIPAENQTVAIQSVHFGRSEVVLRNVSDVTQTIPGGDVGWQWCNVPGYFHISLADGSIVLPPGGTYTFRLIERSGAVRPLFDGEFAEDTNELGIYSKTGAFNNAELIQAFVSWGAGSSFETRESVASMGFKWRFGERIEIQPGHAGFVATGDVTVGAGFTSVPARCLPAQQ